MRKVTNETVRAFLAREKKTVGNTTSTGDELLLHGNCIAYWESDSCLILKMAGWGSVTTRERLNGVLELVQEYRFDIPWIRIAQRKGSQRLLTRDKDLELDPYRNGIAISMRSGHVDLLGSNSEGSSPCVVFSPE